MCQGQGQIFECVFAPGGGIHIDALASNYHLLLFEVHDKYFRGTTEFCYNYSTMSMLG